MAASVTPHAVVRRSPDLDKYSSADIVIGKDVLELVTGAMYVDPMTVFREYVQNAADSIDIARKADVYSQDLTPKISIDLDAVNRTITLRDNGAGISAADFWRRMTSIGASAKRGSNQRGFRGVGRLSGLGYAAGITFRSKAADDSRVSVINWNGRRLREVLRDSSFSGNLDEVIREVASYSTEAAQNTDKAFFEVKLEGVTRVGNDILLNPDEVRAYLGQVAPAPFRDSFILAPRILDLLGTHGIASDIQIQLNADPESIVRPLDNKIRTHAKITDTLNDIEIIEIPSLDGSGIDAVGWIIHHSYLGAIPKSMGYGGLRLRAGNIQVGSSTLLDPFFTEPRFNAWCVGELHVLSRKIIPNGRRDDFELNAHYQNLLGHIAGLAAKISKLCRDRSMQRNRVRRAVALRQAADEQLLILKDKKSPSIIKEHYRTLVTKTLGQLRRIASDKNFSAEDQSSIKKIATSLEKNMTNLRARTNSDPAAQFVPQKHRKVFLDTLKLVINSCDNPEQAAVLTRRVFDKARRRYAPRK